VKSSSVHQYHITESNYYAVFPYKYLKNDKIELISLSELTQNYPKTLEYLQIKSAYLLNREDGKWVNSPNWYEYSRKQNFECQKMQKILVSGLGRYGRYTIGNIDTFIDQGSYGIILKDNFKFLENYLVGILNSKLLDFFLHSISSTLSGGYYSYQTKYLSKIPIKNPDLSNKLEKKLYDSIVKNLNELFNLYENLQKTTLKTKIDAIKNKITYFEDEINEWVLDLYGIINPTEREIILQS
jgi:hypothetical protein